jgi:hypothetical protein
MNALRTHDVTVAEGTFSIILTKQHRLVAAIHAPVTPLGELHLAFEMDRRIDPDLQRRHALAMRGLHPRQMMVGGVFGDLADFVNHAAEGAFNAASKASATVARPAFNVTRDVAQHAMHGIAQVTPFLPAHVRDDIHHAARIVARARLGDMTAKQFLRDVAHAAKAGAAAARSAGGALLDGAKLVSTINNLPMHVLKHVPGVGDMVTSFSPFQRFDGMVSALRHGDFNSLKKMVTDDVHRFQSAASLVPVLGTGISAGLSAGLSALDGGSPLEIAINTAYGAIPIPPGLRSVTDSALAAALELARSGSITDAALAAARDRVPSGLPRDVFDTLARIVVKKIPVQKAAGALVNHYVDRYVGKPASDAFHSIERHVGSAANALKGIDSRQFGTLDPALVSKALRVSGEWTPAEMAAFGLPGRSVAVGGEEPVAYAVAGEAPFADGEEDVAVGALLADLEPFRGTPEQIVGSEPHDGEELRTELLPHPSAWPIGRKHGEPS